MDEDDEMLDWQFGLFFIYTTYAFQLTVSII